MKVRPLGEPVCVAGKTRAMSTLRMRFEVSGQVGARVALRWLPFSGASALGAPARIRRDHHVIAGLDLPFSHLREQRRLTLELWTAGETCEPLWRREVRVERLDEELGLHHLSLLP